MYNYKQIFKQSFKIAWKNPGLWLFGLFAFIGGLNELDLILASSGFGGGGVLFSFWSGLAEGGFFTVIGIQGLIEVLFNSPWHFILISLVFLTVFGLSVVIIWFIIISQSALISQVVSISKNEKVSWQKSFALGLSKFWPVLGLNILIRLALLVAVIAIAILSFFEFSGSLFLFVIGFNIFLFLIIIASFIIKYAICGVILKNWNFKQALRLAWKIFVKNWLLSIEVAIIILFVFLVVEFMLFSILSRIFLFALAFFANSLFGFIIISLFLLLIFSLAQALLAIFNWATWAIVFELIASDRSSLLSWLKLKFKK